MDNHDLCDICNAPQWIMPNGEHRCMTIERLQERYEQDTEVLNALHKYIRGLEAQVDFYRIENDALRGLLKDMNRNAGNH